MKEKKTSVIFFKSITAVAILLGSLTLNGTSISAQVLNSSPVDIGEGAKVYNSLSTKFNDYQKIKTSLKASFIDDPHTNKKIAVITTDGSNINADRKVSFNDQDRYKGYYRAALHWASSYRMAMELNGDGQFYKVSPVNTIDKKTVSSTIGYTIGGSIGDKPSGSANWSTTVSYDQADYKTILKEDTNKKVEWNVPFVSFVNKGWGPYDRDSQTNLYGNELFMNYRDANVWAKDNFTPSDQMPALAAYSFSPAVIAVVIADKSDSSSELTVHLGRTQDKYNMQWHSVIFGAGYWEGKNEKDTSHSTYTTKYILDWNNHQLIEK
ncbi:beta-channel forming cytolysin [Paenibacillus larvae]|uniref:Alpha-toxin n=1 Tax=Paenibacillus larvae subsp. larvae TaxID=147375 RepID=A0A6C0QRH9_9BACL|nr:beta-channel forming cytolysin [Paenibacillus larvae]QHZ51190.1 Alpha-toxin [Paenibacillus larvae subsp. larvae]QHZ52315.1 Alpha-toxin [Paenibacillus larvae subsp. larvae]